MRVGLLAIILILGLSWQSSAQKKTYLGVNAGVNFGTIDLFHSFNGYKFYNGYTTGPQTGIVLMTFLPNHVGLETGVSYVQKGWTQIFETNDPNYQVKLDYLELPFLANYYFGQDDLHFYVNAGCFFEYLVGSWQSASPNTGADDFADDFHAFDEKRDNIYGYGLKGGGGAFYDFNFGTIIFEATLSFSLSHLYDQGPLHSDIPNQSNKINFGISLGYLFSFTQEEGK